MATENTVHQAQSAADYDATAKQKAQAKTARIPIKVVPAGEVLKKPDWIRVKAGSPSTSASRRRTRRVTTCRR